MKTKPNNFRVIEDRGCGIQYPRHFGTLTECQWWMKQNTHTHPLNSGIFVNNDEDANGNGDMFTYTVELSNDN